VILSIAVVLPVPLARAAPSLDPLDIKAAPIGASLADWKASPSPEPASSHIETVCSDRPGGATRLLSTASGTSPDTVVCGYFGRYGRFFLPEPVSVAPRLGTAHARYTFVGRRLQSVEYRFSVNVYDDLIARLHKLYGAPLSVVRDTIRTEAGVFPRVRQTWRAPRGQVELTDPTPPYTELSVKLTGQTAVHHGRPS